MNTIAQTLNRLTALAAALQTLQDNYGIRNEAAFNEQKGELADIIANVDVQPPAPPVTVDDVVAIVSAKISTMQSEFEIVGGKVDELIALANSAGEPAAV